MHNRLKRNLGLREMFKIDSKGTIYFNTAVVPRYKTDEDGKLLINFSWIEFEKKELSMFLIDGIQSLVKFVKKINFFRIRYFCSYFKYFWAFHILKIMFETRYNPQFLRL